MKKVILVISILVLLITVSSNFFQRIELKVESINHIEIYVEYEEKKLCKECPKWILIKSNYKELNKKTAERIYIKNKQSSKTDDLNELYEKQIPLVIKLSGEYSPESLNKHRVFEYSKFTLVEL
jgi:hypothetical protein